MSLKGLPEALGGFGGSVSGSSAAALGEEDELAASAELGAAASGWEPPQAARRTAMDEKTPNRESKLMAISWVETR
jgi:hypothetical protein